MDILARVQKDVKGRYGHKLDKRAESPYNPGMTRGDNERHLHPIGVVATRTGLSPDVIRVWERRYGVVEPVRDDAGRRLYSDVDLERLALLGEATAAGRGISQLVALTLPELRELVRSDEASRWSADRAVIATEAGALDAVVERALAHACALDGPALERELRRAATLLGLTEFLEGVVVPLFRRVGEEWHGGRMSVSQEHLASGVAGSVLTRLASELHGERGAPLMVIATPAGEHHEIGALMVWAEAAAAGWRVAYLGPDVPAPDIVAAAAETEARCVALSLVFGNGNAASEVAAVRDTLPAGVDLIVGGMASEPLEPVAGVKRMADLAMLRRYLREGGAGR